MRSLTADFPTWAYLGKEVALGDLHQFDTTTRTWSDFAGSWTVGSPLARAGHGLAAIAGRLYVFGGFFNTSAVGQAGGLYNDLHEVDLSARSWSPLEVTGTIPTARFGFGFAVSGDTLLLFGGIDASGMQIYHFKLLTLFGDEGALCECEGVFRRDQRYV